MITSALSSAKIYILDFKLENLIASAYLHLDVSQGNPYSVSVNFNAFSLEPPKTALVLTAFISEHLPPSHLIHLCSSLIHMLFTFNQS